MADTQQEIFGRTVYFRGRRLAFETVTSLIGNKPNQTVIFGGLSAGGRGSMVTIDSLKKLLPESTMLYGLHDSGNYVNLNPLTSYYDPFMVQCERAYSLFNEPEVNLKCQEMYPNDTWKCLCGQYMLPLVETPSQVIIHQYDSYQLSQNIGSLPRLWTYDACKYANSQFRPLMKETIGQLMFTNEHVVFAPACYHHGLVQSKSFYDIKINGMSAWDQLEIFMNSQGADREHLVSNCEQVNCQETCPEIETGPNTFCQVF